MGTTVIFYEKPGCGNNARQKQWLTAAGHTVVARNLLTEAWTGTRLRSFFGALPVADWFNRAAPRVKSGEILPQEQNEAGALALMLTDPLLIRRPLIEASGSCQCGFDPAIIDAWIGLSPATVQKLATSDAEACLHASAPAQRHCTGDVA
ncbi:MAG: ArsC/Spx/MgsR family protein [Burkholderiales bacterium]